MTPATLITWLRFIFAPTFCVLVYYNDYGYALLVLVLSGFSDFADGYIAKRTGSVTEFGAMLDPLADKFLMFLAFTTLSLKGYIPWWVSGFVMSRDALILVGVGLLRARHIAIHYKPLIVSKVATLFQILSLIAAFILMYWAERGGDFKPDWHRRFESVYPILLVIVVTTTAVSAIKYASVWLSYFRKREA